MSEKGKELIQIIKSRRSIRNFVFQKINQEVIEDILDCGNWAPSGMNTQPWKVCVVEHPTVKQLVANNSKYGGIIKSAYYNICIFLDLERGYDRVKDIQAIGAFIQNILLAIHSYGLGGVWIGEVIAKSREVAEVFKLDPEKFELMAVIAIGVIDDIKENEEQKSRERRLTEEFVDWF